MKSALIREALKHAEAKQVSQLQVAIAADSRAMTLGVACAGISGVLLGMDAVGSDNSASISALMTSVSFFYAACLSAWSARPIDFHVPGQQFSDFQEDVDANRNFDDVICELGLQLDECARENDLRLKENARFFRAGLFLAALSPLVGLLSLFLNA